MKQKESPERQEPKQGLKYHISLCEEQDKGKPILSKRQKKVYDLLLTGKHSAADISIALGYSDPRSYIRELRNKNINVLDRWIESIDTRYKVYWITPQKTNIPGVHSVGEVIQSDFKNLFERNHYD
jgi:DNA-binding CsgD family transcriptional regulator